MALPVDDSVTRQVFSCPTSVIRIYLSCLMNVLLIGMDLELIWHITEWMVLNTLIVSSLDSTKKKVNHDTTQGGPGQGKPCVFPFRFGGSLRSSCITDLDPEVCKMFVNPNFCKKHVSGQVLVQHASGRRWQPCDRNRGVGTLLGRLPSRADFHPGNIKCRLFFLFFVLIVVVVVVGSN